MVNYDRRNGPLDPFSVINIAKISTESVVNVSGCSVIVNENLVLWISVVMSSVSDMIKQ